MNRAHDPFAHIGPYYDRLVDRFGHDPRACDYGHPDSQAAKFRVIADVAPLDGKSVLDVGCGFADFFDYLRSRFDDVRYTGVDISEAMVKQASHLHPDADIRRLNILDQDPGRFDLVTANGIFYLLGDQAPGIMRRLVARMFEIADHGVAFNSLSAWASDKEDGEFYADPCDTVAFCRTLTPWLTLRHDYHARDFTIYLYKEPPR